MEMPLTVAKTGPKYAQTSVPAILTDFLECEWSVRSAEHALTVYPDGHMELLFDASGKVYLVGVASRAIRWKTDPNATLRGLRLRPGTLTCLFGLPSSELSDHALPISEVPSPLAKEIAGLAGQSNNQDQLLKSVLGVLAKACQAASRPRWLTLALSQIQARSIQSVARSMDSSERHLRRLFLREVGVGPARFKRILRLQQTIDEMRRLPGTVSAAQIALDAGFSDQAHMSHEIKGLTGKTPSELLAELSYR
jgi:AraC-like DNA-binding protein